jgi:hypothetical protein
MEELEYSEIPASLSIPQRVMQHTSAGRKEKLMVRVHAYPISRQSGGKHSSSSNIYQHELSWIYLRSL